MIDPRSWNVIFLLSVAGGIGGFMGALINPAWAGLFGAFGVLYAVLFYALHDGS